DPACTAAAIGEERQRLLVLEHLGRHRAGIENVEIARAIGIARRRARGERRYPHHLLRVLPHQVELDARHEAECGVDSYDVDGLISRRDEDREAYAWGRCIGR